MTTSESPALGGPTSSTGSGGSTVRGVTDEDAAPALDRKLPALTAAELRALGDAPGLASLVDLAWWDDLPESARTAVLEMARRALIARDLVSTGERITLAPEVELVLRARSRAPYVAIGQEAGPRAQSPAEAVEPDGEAAGSVAGAAPSLHRVLLYGIEPRGPAATGAAGPGGAAGAAGATGVAGTDGTDVVTQPAGPCVLLEIEFDGIHSFRLCDVPRGMAAMATWLLREDPERATPRIVDVVVPTKVGPAVNRAVLVVSSLQSQVRYSLRAGMTAARGVDRDELAAWLVRACRSDESGDAADPLGQDRG